MNEPTTPTNQLLYLFWISLLRHKCLFLSLKELSPHFDHTHTHIKPTLLMIQPDIYTTSILVYIIVEQGGWMQCNAMQFIACECD
jgi:hypothetical protein